MAKDHSLDIVSKVDMQELHNALAQAGKEIQNRYDFKGTSAGIKFEEDSSTLKLTADHDMQLKAVLDVLVSKLVKRSVSPKAFSWKEAEKLPSGGLKKQGALQQGLSTEKAKEIVKSIKDLGLKVQPRIDGDSVRVAAKQIDDLQTIVQAFQEKDFGVPLLFENYR